MREMTTVEKVTTGAAVAGIIAFLGALSTLFFPVGGSAPAAVAEPAPAPPVPVPPAIPAERDYLAEARSSKTLVDAVGYAKPFMTDEFNKSSRGTYLFAAWAIVKMTWVDVAVPVDETSHAKIQKDVDAERGKRLCVTGSIVEIAAVKDGPRAIAYEGLTHGAGGALYHFLATGDTGELVAGSMARFCGVVTGRYDYANSAGGSSHAVDVVGMFDLPANRVALVAKP